ncbi:hypothetical protein [Nocardia macrotermitis]|uniref:Uncharacterized protein n=1 Tax=Nocardia macrotermitis TaxID=2585198 RepID=A0A7K0DAR5_9NOCA|nr:hypothetical protein [Nocardia macrotermitis]MQY22876.1 hypothetical protein [Nocardia macrotermitis]
MKTLALITLTAPLVLLAPAFAQAQTPAHTDIPNSPRNRCWVQNGHTVCAPEAQHRGRRIPDRGVAPHR